MLIGISGLAGSGKDAAANFLVEDYGFTKVALADPLKRIAQYVYAFTDEQLWGPSHFRNAPDERYPRPCKTCGGAGDKVPSRQEPLIPCLGCHGARVTYLAPRECLQKIGTEFGRECYPNTWVDLCIRTSKELLADKEARYDQKHGRYRSTGESHSRVLGVAVPDVRFLNEVQAIKQAGGKVIRISRPGAGLDGAGALHTSETEQAGLPDSMFDQVIQNTGTLEELRAAVQAFLSA
jgi:hypothetical protein